MLIYEQALRCLSGGMQNVEPLESWVMKKGRYGQLSADGAAFCVYWVDRKKVWCTRISHCLVPLRIEGYEAELRAKAKAAGGRWNPEKQLWYVRYGKISGTTLEKHIHVDESG